MRVVLLGLGAVSHHILIPAVRAQPGLTIAAAADPDPKARERAPGIPDLHADPESAIAAGRPDLVVVATPPDSHRELCLAGLEAGAHVFCEKPFAPSVRDVDAILAAAQRAGRQVAVNNQYYRMPVFAALHRAIREKRAGDLRFVSSWQTMMGPIGRGAGWRGTQRRATLFEFGTHAIDLILFFFGQRPRAVTAAVASDGGPREWDAFTSVTLHFADGRIATLVTDRVSRGRWRYLDFRLEGSEGTLRASLGGEARLTGGIDGLARLPFLSLQLTRGGLAWIERGERRRILARNPGAPFTQAAAAHLAAFVEAIAAGRPFERDASGNRAAIEVIAAAYLSAEQGRRIDLDRDGDAVAALTMG